MRPIAQLDFDEERGIVLARLAGEIDLSNADAVRLRIEQGVPNTALGLMVDLSAVRYLDSSGIRLLFELARRLERRQQRLATVVPADSPVREIIEMAGGTDRLGLHESPREAGVALYVDSVIDESG